MDNIEEILRALAEDDGEEDAPESSGGSEGGEQGGGLFGNLDPSMLLSMMSLFESMNKPDDNERLLLALKPLLREENRDKIDSALKFMKIFALLPILRESGLLGKLF